MITEETVVPTGSLDKLAKLLAAENITVEHRSIPTAYFDTKNRVLALPMWKDMPEYLYHFLVLHEVGHALYTDPTEWKDSIEAQGSAFHGYMNVIEDARIERKMKIKFPGSRRDFIDAYNDLHRRNFFKLTDRDMTSLSLIDRINLYFKLGTRIKLRFTDEEMKYVLRAEQTATMQDVYELSLELFELAKQKQEEQQLADDHFDDFQDDEGEGEEGDDFGDEDEPSMSEDGNDSEETDQDGDNEEDSDSTTSSQKGVGDNIERATTDEALQDRMQELIDDKFSYIKTDYYHIPANIDSNLFVVSYKTILEMYQKDCAELNTNATNFRNKLMLKFRSDNNSAINYMVKEFEMKKAASAYSRSKQAKTGVIDTNKLHGYKFNDDIFRRLSIVPDGKNHGLMIYVDFSGSMCSNFNGTIQQLLNVVTFCRRVGIAHRVFAFSSAFHHRVEEKQTARIKCCEANPGKKIFFPDHSLSLLELFHEKMSLKEFNDMLGCLLLVGYRYEWNKNDTEFTYRDDMPYDFCSFLKLGSTPLNDALLVARDIMKKFRKEKNIEILNFVCITDGESNNSNTYQLKHDWKDKESYYCHAYNLSMSGTLKRSYIVDDATKIQARIEYKIAYCSVITSLLSRPIRDELNVNMIGFYIVGGRYDVSNVCTNYMEYNWSKIDDVCKTFTKEGSVVVPNMLRFDEFYLIRGGRQLNTETATMDAAATKGQLLREFRKAQSKRGASRSVLSRFIEKIAA